MELSLENRPGYSAIVLLNLILECYKIDWAPWGPGEVSGASQIAELLEEASKHPEEWRRLLNRIAVDLATNETLRAVLLEGLYRDIATKQDLEKLESRLRSEIEDVERRLKEDMKMLKEDIRMLHKHMDDLHKRIDNLFKRVIGLLATIWATIAVLLIQILLRTIAG